MTRWNNGTDATASVSPDITEETNALPVNYFTDPAVHEMEKEKVFSRYWVYAGHENALEEPGDYFTRTIGDKQIIVLRDKDREVRAFFNVCAHRGSKMVEDTPMTDPDNANGIRCPYHLWTYELDGDLRSTPQSFEEADINPDLEDDDSANSTARRTVSWKSNSTRSGRYCSSTSTTTQCRSRNRPAR